MHPQIKEAISRIENEIQLHSDDLDTDVPTFTKDLQLIITELKQESARLDLIQSGFSVQCLHSPYQKFVFCARENSRNATPEYLCVYVESAREALDYAIQNKSQTQS